MSQEQRGPSASAGFLMRLLPLGRRFPLVPHAQPRFSAFSDSEAVQTLVYVTFKHDRLRMVRCSASELIDPPLHSEVLPDMVVYCRLLTWTMCRCGTASLTQAEPAIPLLTVFRATTAVKPLQCHTYPACHSGCCYRLVCC